MSGLGEDLKHAFRNLRRSRSLWVSGAVVLALGVGATTAVFALIDAVVLRPRDFRPSDALVLVGEQRPTGDASGISPAEFTEWRRGQTSSGPFERMASFYRDTTTITGGPEAERVDGARVSSDFFEVLQVSLQAGRTFNAGDEQPRAPAVAIVSQQLWQRYFGAASLRGQFLKLDDVPVEIVGVTKAPFGFPQDSQVWRPLSLDPARVVRTHFLTVIARVKAGTGLRAAQDYLEAINHRAPSGVQNAQRHNVRIFTLHDAVLGTLRFALSMLFAAVLLVLLLACCSVASVLFARAAKRRSHIAMVMALGASRARLLRQLFFESIILAMPAAASGLLLAGIGLRLLQTLYPDALPGLTSVPLNPAQVVFAVAVAAGAALLSTVLPALQSTHLDLVQLLKELGTAVVGGGQHVTRGLLISAQSAIAIILMFAAGLLMETFDNLRAVDPGFRADRVVILNVILPGSRYTGPRVAQFYSELFERLRAIPGVSGVAAVASLPLQGGRATRSFWIEGALESGRGEPARAHVNVVSVDYFATMQIPLIAGRDFTPGEMTGPNNVVVVNETLAKRFFGDEHPIGRQVRFDDSLGKETATIIGVTGDVRQTRLQDAAEPEIYSTRLRSPRLTLVVRTDREPEGAVAAIRTVVRELDADLPASPKSLASVVDLTIGAPALRAAVLAVLAGTALLIATVGLGGFIAFRVSERIPELGVRVALGGRPHQIVLAIIRSELTWPLIGLVMGVAGALGAARLLGSLLYGVSPLDAGTLAAVVGFMLIAMLLSAIAPVRQALDVNPLMLVRRPTV